MEMQPQLPGLSRVIGVLGFTEVMTHLVNWYVGECTAGTNRCVLNVQGFKSSGGSQVRQSHAIVDQGWLTKGGGGGGGGGGERGDS